MRYNIRATRDMAANISPLQEDKMKPNGQLTVKPTRNLMLFLSKFATDIRAYVCEALALLLKKQIKYQGINMKNMMIKTCV